MMQLVSGTLAFPETKKKSTYLMSVQDSEQACFSQHHRKKKNGIKTSYTVTEREMKHLTTLINPRVLFILLEFHVHS